MIKADTRAAALFWSGKLGLVLWIGGLALVLSLCGALALTLLVEQRVAQAMAPDQRSLMQTAASTVTQSLTRALAHDLPLTELPQTEAYLATLHRQLPMVTRLELQIGDRIFASGLAEARPPEHWQGLDFGVVSAAAPVTEMRFWLARPVLAGGALGQMGLLLAAGLIAGLLAAGVFGMTGLAVLRRAETRLSTRLAALRSGDFRLPPPQKAGPMAADAALLQLGHQLEQVNLRHDLLCQTAQGLRAIDHDGSLSQETDRIMADLPAHWQFGRETAAVKP